MSNAWTMSRAAGLSAALAATLALATPAEKVVPWRPARISSPQFESHAAFDPLTGDLYFVRSSPSFEGWHILTSHCDGQGWSEPKAAAFGGDGVDADPYFTADGQALYFISARTVNGVDKRKDLDLWRVDRRPDRTWGEPVRLPEPVNSPGAEWFPRPAPDGWLYFGSNRPGGLGGNDIWRARREASGLWSVENLGPTVNTPGDEYEPLPSADGKRMIVMADGGLYESHPEGKGWAPRRKLGPEVNVNGSEIGALFSPSGRSLMFSRDLKGGQSGEFFVWYEHGVEAWPPSCGSK
jgi:WD40-like Beta Propeller Repeat